MKSNQRELQTSVLFLPVLNLNKSMAMTSKYAIKLIIFCGEQRKCNAFCQYQVQSVNILIDFSITIL